MLGPWRHHLAKCLALCYLGRWLDSLGVLVSTPDFTNLPLPGIKVHSAICVRTWEYSGLVRAGATPDLAFYQQQQQQQPVGGFPRQWPAQLGGPPSRLPGLSPAGAPLLHGAVPPAMSFADHDSLNWGPMWRSIMPQSNGMPMMPVQPAAQVCATPAMPLLGPCVGALEAATDWRTESCPPGCRTRGAS